MSDKLYVCSYWYNCVRWSLQIHARDEAEAKRRLEAIGKSGVVDGEHKLTIPYFPGARLLANLIVWWRNTP